MPESVRLKISRTMKRRKINVGKNNPMYGKSYWKNKKRKNISGENHWFYGVKRPELSKNRLGAKNPNWKGTKVGYQALHGFIRRKYGKAFKCESSYCSRTSIRYEWANKSKKYLRKRSDWIQLCKSCHNIYDEVYLNLCK